MKLQFKFNRALSRGALPPGDRRFWFFFRSAALRIQLGSTNRWIFEVFYRRLMLVMLATGLVLWLAAATALFYWLDRGPKNQVGWLDLAAPWRWTSLREKRGDTAILVAMEEMKTRNFSNAFYNLRAGVARSPENVEGRLLLARLQAPYDPVRAITTMEEGIPFSYDDPVFLSGLLGLYSSQQIRTGALETIDALLAGRHGALSRESIFVLGRSRASLLVQLERFDEAEQTLAALAPGTPEETAAVTGLRIELLLRAGRPADARQLDARRAAKDPASLRQSVEIAIALEDSDGTQSALRQLKGLSEVEPGPYLMSFMAWHRLKRGTFRDAAEDEYYRLFSSNDAALQAIAAMAVNLNIPDAIDRAQRVAVSARLSPFAFKVHHTELALRQGEIERAMRLLPEWENTVDTLKNTQQFYPEFIKRLARAAFAGTPEQAAYLVNHLSSNRGQATLPVFNLAVTVLTKAANFEAARQVLQASQPLFPRSEPLLAARTQVEAQLALVAAAGAANQPAQTEAAPAVTLPATGAEACALVENLLKNDQWSAARDALRVIRSQKPAWLAESEGRVAALDVELALLTLDQLASRGMVRSYLGRFRGEADTMLLVDVVARLTERKRPADARMLYDELLDSTNSTVAVQRALRDLNMSDDLATKSATLVAALDTLDAWILTQEWAQAERMLKYLRDRPPEWMAASWYDVKMREVRIRLGLSQRPQAMTALRELVLKSGRPRSVAFELVNQLMAEGQQDTANLLAREIVRLMPDTPAAASLLKHTEVPLPPGP